MAMNLRTRSVKAGAVAALIAMLGCAHAPASKPEVADKVFITGSHIPVRVDPKNGMPVTTSPVQIYSRDQITGTGVPDTGRALLTLDPSVTIGP
jgi:hypothetical protein